MGLDDESLVFEPRLAEVQQKASMMSGGAELVEQLSLFNDGEGLQRLQLDHHVGKADEIRTVPALQDDALVQNWHLDFAAKRNTSKAEFECQRRLIHGFEEARTELRMHFHSGTEDRVRLRIAERRIRFGHGDNVAPLPICVYLCASVVSIKGVRA